MGLQVAQVTTKLAKVMLLQVWDPEGAIRPGANRLKVWRKGNLVAQTAEMVVVI